MSLAAKWSGARVVRDGLAPSIKVQLKCLGPGRTDKSQAKDCDVNVIVERFVKTGVLPGVDAQKTFADVSDPVSYQDAMNVVLHARSQFDSLTARVRKRFDNDPSLFLAFCNDPRNAKEMIDLGLATERPLPDLTRRELAAAQANEVLKKQAKGGKPPLPANDE